MVNICVICMACDSLKLLSEEHRGVLESLISTAVNLKDLHDLKLLVCSSCLSLIKSLAELRNTAITGVKHLLRLSQKKSYEPEEVLIKEEPPDKDNSINTVIEMEIEEECENKLHDEMKLEVSEQWQNIEDVIPKSTIQVTYNNIGEVEKAPDSRQTPLVSQSEKTAVFTHSKVVQSNVKSEKQTTNIAAFPNIQLVPQNQTKTTQNTPLQFLNPAQFLPTTYCTLNMPTYVPGKMQKRVIVMPTLRNITLKPEAPKNIVLKALAPKRLDERNPGPRCYNNNPETSARKFQPVRILKKVTVVPTLVKMAFKQKAAETMKPSPAAPKPLEESNSEPRINNNNPKASEEEVVVKWYTRVLTRHQIFIQCAKERNRPEFAGAPYKCKTCILLFGSQEEMEAHAKEHVLASDELPCQVCALPVRPSDEDAHMAKHATRLQCARCAFSTEQLQVIESHDCSSQPAKRISHNRQYGKPFGCDLCRTRYADVAALTAHNERSHKNPAVYKCDVCNKEFAGKVKLRLHKKNGHKPKDNGIDALRPELYCAECNIAFSSAYKYRQHRMILKHCPRDSWNFECDTCNKRFRNKRDIMYHIGWMHSEKSRKSYVCEECGECARSAYRLRQHKLKHIPLRERSRPHVCHLCGKAFVMKKTLSEHMLMHAGLRPHACPLCPATFTYSSALFTHNQLKHLKIKRNTKKKKIDDKVQKRKEDKKAGEVKRKKGVSEAES